VGWIGVLWPKLFIRSARLNEGAETGCTVGKSFWARFCIGCSGVGDGFAIERRDVC
jgi:hypothetical protein